MDSPAFHLAKRTVPSQFHHTVEHIFLTSKDYEEDRLKESQSKPKRFHRDDAHSAGASSVQSVDVEGKSIHLAIARVVMQLWSPPMFRYAEDLILTKAIEEKYLEEKHRKFVHVFEDDINEDENTGWIIKNQDEAIIELLWDIFKLKENYDEVYHHRSFILKSYDRLKKFLPETDLHPEIIERHDLSKYAFNQAIGYTLKFTHKIWHPIWKAACDLHLNQELHHPQAWAKRYSPERKRFKIRTWMRSACDFDGKCAYGINLETLNLDSEHLPLPFLLESYVDMVAIEWEKKKGGRMDISDSELIYMDEKFLGRYVDDQRKKIFELVNFVICSDQSWKNVKLADREEKLLGTVPEKEKGPIIFRIGNHKKQELERLKKKMSGFQSQGECSSSDATDEMMKKASDYAFNFNVSLVVMEVWNNKFRKFIEQLVLNRAIKEGYIKDYHMKWIFFAESENVSVEPQDTSMYNPSEYDSIVDLIWEEYNMREHFSQMKEHRSFLKRSYERLSRFMPELPEEVIERHDLSKFAFSQAVGYTLKWVHDINSLTWTKACDMHLHKEPHHPQMWQNRHSTIARQNRLESFLCLQAGGSKYGIEINQMNWTSENMALVFLLESIVDMVAVEWERNKNKREGMTYTEFVDMDEKFLNRYSAHDKGYVKKFMKSICDADVKGLDASSE